MSLGPGSRLDAYELLQPLGAGGMGEVWLATEVRLGRKVAVKLLPDELTRDAQRVSRFEQEARAASALNHPNVCTILALGETGEGQHYIAMEYVEGETLRQRFAPGRLNVRESLDIGIQIAAALVAAHAAGIVHRDIKPENAMLRPDGLVKVLDFGLAKLTTPIKSDVVQSTQTAFRTDAGRVVGTVAYMSPEQARGQPVEDARTDIWSLGVMLYEMVAGRSPFARSSSSDTLAAILDRDPSPLARFEPDAPAELQRIVTKALRKDRSLRYQTSQDLLLDLQTLREELSALTRSDHIGQQPTESSGPATTTLSPTERLVHQSSAEYIVAQVGRHKVGAALVLIFVAGMVAALEALAGWWVVSRPSGTLPTYNLDLQLDGLEVMSALPTLSPNGRWLVYRASGRLWLRALNEFTSTPLPDSFGAEYPFWSPDSRQIAFVRDRKLWRLPIDAANATPLADAPAGLSGSGAGVWTVDGDLLVAGSDTIGLFSVSEHGENPRDLLPLDRKSQIDFHHIAALPEGRGVLVAVHRAEGSDTIAALVNSRLQTVLQLPGETIGVPVYSPDGYLLFERETTGPGIWAVGFSVDRLAAEGTPFLLVPGGSSPSLASDGTLAFVRGRPLLSELVWIDRKGSIESIGALRGQLGQGSGPVMALSPDETRIALSMDAAGGTELWSYDLARGSLTRLSTGATRVTSPIWTPDGQQVLFGAFGRGRLWNVYSVPAREAREPARVLPESSMYQWPCSISPDGRWLIYATEGADRATDLWIAPLGEPSAAQPLMKTSFREDYAKFSPDGASILYASDESGRTEVYMRAFPVGSERVQVSTNGGSMPTWAHDGLAIFYRTPTALMKVTVSRTAAGLTASARQQLFTIDPSSSLFESFIVTSDGRFLFARATGRVDVGVMLNWSRGLTQLESRPRG